MDEHERCIRNAAQVAHDLLHALHRANPSDPTFDQVGFLDGRDSVIDYIEHGERGVALEHLLYMIHEANIAFPHALLLRLHEIAEEYGLDVGYSPS